MSKLRQGDEHADIGRALLNSAKHDGPTPAAVRRARTAVLLAVATSAASTTVTAGGAAIHWVAPTKWIGLGAIVGLGVVGADHWLAGKHRGDSASFISVPPPATSLTILESAGETAVPAASPEPPPASAVPNLRAHQPTTRSTAPVSEPEPIDSAGVAAVAIPPAPGSTLTQEVAAIDNARRALAAGQPASALTSLDRYEQDYPRGHLGQEATFVRMQALLQLGDRAAAMRLAERFLTTNPQSPLARRVRTLMSLPAE